MMNKNIKAVIGMSVGNSYFKEEKISFLLKTCVQKYDNAIVMIPPAFYNYKAIGYNDVKAARKARLKANALNNIVQRTIKSNPLLKDKVSVFDFSAPAFSEKHQVSLLRLEKLYKENILFQQDVNGTTSEYIKSFARSTGRELESVEGAVEIARKYLLEEFAFMESFDDKTDARYVYHREWPVYTNYIDGKYDDQKKDNISFEIIKYDKNLHIFDKELNEKNVEFPERSASFYRSKISQR